MADLKKTGVRLVAEDARAFESDMGKATGAVQGFSKAANSLDMSGMNKSLASLNLQQTGESINNNISRPLGQAALASIDTAATFEETLSGVEAVLSPTTNEMAKLEQMAIDLGGSTKFSAQESAAGIEMLAKNGLSATEILGGALDATLSFAAATGADLPESADIATDAMLAFDKEASELPDVINDLTGVTVNSKFGWQDLSLAMAQGGGVFAGVGGELDNFATTLAVISPLFKSGSDAGTSLKTLMTRLVPGSKDAAAAMRELGIITADGQNQFFTASGQLRSMTEITNVLAEATAGLSEEERNRHLTTIFGQDAMRSAIALSNAGAEGFTEMQSSLAQVDAGSQAATRMDNLKGSIQLLQSAVETLQIEFAGRFLPGLRKVVDTVTEGVRWFGELPAPVQNAALALGAIAVAAGPLIIALGAVSGAIVAIPIAFATLAPLAPGFLALGATVAGMATAWVTDFGDIRDKTSSVFSFLQSSVNDMTSDWDEGFEEIQGVTSDTLSTLQSSFSRWGPKMQSLWDDTTAELSEAWDTAIDNVSTFLTDHRVEIDAIMGAIPGVVEGAWNTIERTISDAVGIIAGTIEGFTGLLAGDWKNAQNGAQKVVEGVWSQIQMRIEMAWGVIQGVLSTFGVDTTGLQSTIEAFSSAASEAVTSLQNTISSVFGKMGDENTDLGNKVLKLQETWQITKETIVNIVTPLWEIIKSLFGEGQKFIEAHGNEIETFMSTVWESIGGIISTTWDIIIEVIQVAMGIINATVVPVLTAIQEFIQAHSDEIQMVLDGAWGIISSVITGALSVIEDTLTIVLAILQGDWETAWTSAGDIVETVWGTLEGVVNGALSVIEGAIGMVLGLIGDSWNAAWNSAWDAVGGFLEKFTNITFDTEPFLNAGENLIGALQNGMQTAWDTLWGWITGLFGFGDNGLARTISDYTGNWTETGRNLIDGIKKGMEESYHRLTDWLSDKAKDLPEPIREILGISSPSTVMAERAGAPSAEGIGVGFAEKIGPVKKEMAKSVKSLGDIPVPSMGLETGQRLPSITPTLDQDIVAMQQFGAVLDEVTGKMVRMQSLTAMSAEVSMRMQEQSALAAQSTTNNYNLNVSSNAPMRNVQGEFNQMAALNR